MKRAEKQVLAGYVNVHDNGLGDDVELQAELAEVAALEKQLAVGRKERSGEDKRAKIKARDALAELALVRKEKERLQGVLAVRCRSGLLRASAVHLSCPRPTVVSAMHAAS